MDLSEFTPALVNNSEVVKKTVPVLRQVLGEANVEQRPPVMGGEDFSRYGREGLPIFMFNLGTIPPERVALANREGGPALVSLHSDLYYPVPEPSIKTGVLTMSMAVLNLVGK